MMLRIAHLSDPHFSKVTLNPSQFLSKRWIGNFNLLFLRKQFYTLEPLKKLPAFLNEFPLDALFFTGDFSCTALKEEFLEAATFLKQFKAPVFTVPGNHDVYTVKAQEEKSYYTHFPNSQMEKTRVSLNKIAPKWWAISLDCALATPPFFSYGVFFPEMEEALEEAFASIPKEEWVIIANHFPLFYHNHPRHDLRRSDQLQAILKRHPNVRLYLHGHDHVPYVEDRRVDHLPYVFNAGSCARKSNGGFSIYDLDDSSCLHQRYVYTGKWRLFSKELVRF